MGLQILGNKLKRQRIVNQCAQRSQACVLWLFLPTAQTRASPPHQAKIGLDGDPGVWAYVGIAKLL